MKTIEPSRRFHRFSPQVSDLLGRVRTAWGQIEAARIWPASVEALRFSALVGTIHYSTLLEGNRLSVAMAERAARNELDAQTKAEIELVNYVDALATVDDLSRTGDLVLSEQLLLRLHLELTKGLGDPKEHFRPEHEGFWRDGEAVVYDALTDQVVHRGCPQVEVRPRMLGLIEWVQEVETRPVDWPIHVVAGLVHHNITEIHPFADGNGRTARLMTTVLLQRHSQIPGQMFDFDRHYGENRDAYLAALRSCQGGAGSHETWIRYFLLGMAEEYERVAREVDRLSHIGTTRGGRRIQLSETQQVALTNLTIRKQHQFTRTDYEESAKVSSTTANRDLKEMADAGVLDRIGTGSASAYRFSSVAVSNPWESEGKGRPRTWTDERIEKELRELIGTSGRFPTVEEFKQASTSGLRAAIQRNGGAAAWAKRIGVPEPRTGNPPHR